MTSKATTSSPTSSYCQVWTRQGLLCRHKVRPGRTDCGRHRTAPALVPGGLILPVLPNRARLSRPWEPMELETLRTVPVTLADYDAAEDLLGEELADYDGAVFGLEGCALTVRTHQAGALSPQLRGEFQHGREVYRVCARFDEAGEPDVEVTTRTGRNPAAHTSQHIRGEVVFGLSLLRDAAADPAAGGPGSTAHLFALLDAQSAFDALYLSSGAAGAGDHAGTLTPAEDASRRKRDYYEYTRERAQRALVRLYIQTLTDPDERARSRRRTRRPGPEPSTTSRWPSQPPCTERTHPGTGRAPAGVVSERGAPTVLVTRHPVKESPTATAPAAAGTLAAVAAPAAPTTVVTNAAGREFTVRLVRTGERPHSRDNSVRNDRPTLVEFYDRTYIEGFTPHGQFVSSYYLATLLDDSDRLIERGLSLDYGIPQWSVTGANVGDALAFATAHTILTD